MWGGQASGVQIWGWEHVRRPDLGVVKRPASGGSVRRPASGVGVDRRPASGFWGRKASSVVVVVAVGWSLSGVSATVVVVAVVVVALVPFPR